MIRFIHTADWQIGRQYGQVEADESYALAEARFSAVERIASLASEHSVHAVLVAGDVFDAQTVSDKTIHRLFAALRGYQGPWFLLPGNHDAALTESVWARAVRLNAIPENVQVCQKPEPCLVPGTQAVILPAPLAQRHTYNDLTEWFAHRQTEPGVYRLGLAHGCVQGILAEDIDSTNPVAAERAATARLDYLALGDWHGAKQVDERTWYSGTPEPDRWKDNGAGNVLLVELESPGRTPKVTPIPTAHYRWRSESRNIQVSSDVDAVEALLSALDAHDVLQLNLSGQVDLAGRRRVIAAIGRARGLARCIRADTEALAFEPTQEDVDALGADGYLGEAIANLRKEQGAPEGAVPREALLILATLLDKQKAEGAAT